MSKELKVYGLESLPLVQKGDNIGEMILDAAENEGVGISKGDIIVVGHKIVSKAEGRVTTKSPKKYPNKVLRLARQYERAPPLIHGIISESKEVLKVWDKTFIVRDWRGFVCINAGIDTSNVSVGDDYLLLPRNPDSSAESIRRTISEGTGKEVGVVVTDTYSRPLRRGLVDFAVGLAGVKVFEDYRGKHDLFGKVIRSKVVAKADELAAAAELVMGQGAEGIPVAIVRGVGDALVCDDGGSNELIITSEEDMFGGVV